MRPAREERARIEEALLGRSAEKEVRPGERQLERRAVVPRRVLPERGRVVEVLDEEGIVEVRGDRDAGNLVEPGVRGVARDERGVGAHGRARRGSPAAPQTTGRSPAALAASAGSLGTSRRTSNSPRRARASSSARMPIPAMRGRMGSGARTRRGASTRERSTQRRPRIRSSKRCSFQVRER